MSRIEEALRRVEGSVGSQGVADGGDSVPSLGGEPQLFRYPQEGAASRPRPVPGTAEASRAQPRRRSTRTSFRDAAPGKLLLSDACPVAVEQYRRLAAAVIELQATHKTKVLMVASALPREGKTLTVSNLALTLSESYHRRVLLIDADLRRPSIHELFQLPNARGLGDGLRSPAGPLTILPVTPLLSVLPAGRPDPNPTGGLASARMQVLLAEAAAAFDFVLLDAPPVGMMPDAHLLARLTQGVIFVIAAGTTPFALIERAIVEIGRESVIGTVLNRIDEANIPATDYYHDYYQATTGTPP